MEALDVIKNIRPGFGAGTVVSAVYTLALEHAEEAFGSGVIRTATDRAHAAHQVVTGQKALILIGSKLAAEKSIDPPRTVSGTNRRPT